MRPVVPGNLTALRPGVDLGVTIMKPGARVTTYRRKASAPGRLPGRKPPRDAPHSPLNKAAPLQPGDWHGVQNDTTPASPDHAMACGPAGRIVGNVGSKMVRRPRWLARR